MDLVSFIEHTIATLGWKGVFLGSVLEEIVAPIPSAIVQSGAGFLLLGDQPWSGMLLLNIILIIALPSAFGVVLGSLPIYTIAYFGGQPALKKWGKYFFLKYNKVMDVRDRIMSYKSLPLVLMVPRFVLILPNVVITAGAGLLRIPLWTYLWTTFIGTFVRAIYLGLVGWSANQASSRLFSSASLPVQIGVFVLVIAVVALLSFWFVEYVKRRDKKIQKRRSDSL
jgi:membrane protein DedA with SNARE-associated domain